MNALLKFVAKQLFGQKGVIANNKAVNFEAAKLAEKLSEFGIDPNSIKTEKQLQGIVNQIKAFEKKRMAESMEVISQDDPRFKGIMDKMMGSNVIKRDFGKPFSEEVKKKSDEEILSNIKKSNERSLQNLRMQNMDDKVAADMFQGGPTSRDPKTDADMLAEFIAEDAGKIYDDLDTKERLKFYDRAYNAIMRYKRRDPEDMADGGRIGFKKGMSRRTFLGLMGAGAAGIGAAKTGLLKLLGKGKATAKIAEVTTPSVAGKPSWFDALANRVISEGENVTKRFATKDREIVHVKALDDETTVYVYRDLDDGSVRIDIDDPFRNVQGDQGDALVSLEYKPGIADEGTKGKPPDTFQAVENDYANYMDGPDDYVTEVTDNTVTNTKDLTADLTKVKLYAKGQKKPTLKEFVESRKRKEALKQAEENPSQYAADRYSGPEPDTDYIDEKASGGLAGMLGE